MKLTVHEYRRRKRIGAELQRARMQAMLSLEEAAARVRRPVRTWKRWEAGQSAIPLELVANICVALRDDHFVSAITPQLCAA